MHSADANKDLSQFTASFVEQVDRDDFDFRGFVFPPGFRLPRGTYQSATFYQVTFFGEFWPRNSRFVDDTFFNDSTFMGSVKLIGAGFVGDVRFTGSTFNGDFDASNVTFEGSAEFDSTTFVNRCDFRGSTVAATADFQGAKFLGRTIFDRFTVNARTYFNGAEFAGPSWFNDAVISDFASFSDVNFTSSDMHYWRNMTCNGGATFEAASPLHNVDFRKSKFGNMVIFNRARISGIISFSNCTFEGEVSFSETILDSALSFFDSTFSEDVSLSEVQVPDKRCVHEGNYLSFSKAKFLKRVSIRSCDLPNTRFESAELNDIRATESEFHGNASFKATIFASDLILNRVNFHKELELDGARLPDNFVFRDVWFRGPVTLVGTDLSGIGFSGVNLEQVRFADCLNVAKAEFDDVKWARWPSPQAGWAFRVDELWRMPLVNRWPWWPRLMAAEERWSRVAVADELVARGRVTGGHPWRDSLRSAERVYRGLRASHESQKDHPRVGDFYFAEMEMRRLRGSLNPASPDFDLLTPLYWLLSGYGERGPLAGMWFLVLWVACAALYLVAGLFVKVPTTNPTSGALQASPKWIGFSGWLSSCTSVECRLSEFGDALVHSLYVATFIGRDAHAQVVNGLGQFVQFAELGIGPLLLALALLAVRRRFQR